MGAIFIARDVDGIVGMVNVLFSISTALGERVALLEDMVVAPSARSAGAGSRLLSHAIDWTRAQGCKRITLLTDQSNAAARRFHQRHGFTRSSMVPMRLHLE